MFMISITKMIIGLAGKMGCGKNFIAENVIVPLLRQMMPERNVMCVAFADQLKINTIVKYGVEHNAVFYKKDDATRRLLQVEGTENGRLKLGEDLWIRYLSEWIKVYKSKGIQDFIITDVRFKNESSWIKDQGGVVIKVVARDLSDTQNVDTTHLHSSETNIDKITADLVLENNFDGKQHLGQTLESYLNSLLTKFT